MKTLRHKILDKYVKSLWRHIKATEGWFSSQDHELLMPKKYEAILKASIGTNDKISFSTIPITFSDSTDKIIFLKKNHI